MGGEIEKYLDYENELRQDLNLTRQQLATWQRYREALIGCSEEVIAQAFSALRSGGYLCLEEVLGRNQFAQCGVFELRRLCAERGITGASRMSRVTMERLLKQWEKSNG